MTDLSSWVHNTSCYLVNAGHCHSWEELVLLMWCNWADISGNGVYCNRISSWIYKLFEVADALHCGNAHMHINISDVTSTFFNIQQLQKVFVSISHFPKCLNIISSDQVFLSAHLKWCTDLFIMAEVSVCLNQLVIWCFLVDVWSQFSSDLQHRNHRRIT